MTYAPDSIKAAQRLVRDRTGLPWVSLGIIGDDDHDGGYHCGKDRVDADDYSVDESPRDRRGLTNAASALDVGDFDTGDANLIDMSLWIVAECEAGAPDTRDIREIIYYDGGQVRRYDREGERDSGDDSHETHTHFAWYRDSEHRDKTAIFRRYFDTAAGTPRLVPYPTLRENDSGPRVAHLQRALNEALGLDLAVDEDYGPKTTAGVKALQRAAGIDDDGIYGRDSAAALRHLLEDDMSAFDVWSYTNDRLTTEDAYAHLRGTRADVRAIRKGQEALLDALQGVDGAEILARIDQRAAEDAERDTAAAERDGEILALIQQVGSGQLAAEAVVAEIARLLGQEQAAPEAPVT